MAAQSPSPTRGMPLGEPVDLPEAAKAAPAAIARNSTWRKILRRAEIAAPRLKLAVIEGGMGTGKHTLARFLHSHSLLAKSPFRRRDAREWLATESDPAAVNGFLYLDRIDLLTASGQAIFLGVLKALEDQGATRAVLVASTNFPVDDMARRGAWMPELAFRLSAVRFALPLLREQRAELAPLVDDLLARLSTDYRQRPATLGPGVLARLLEHDWPGNLRELASVLEGAFLGSTDGVIRLDDLALPGVPAREKVPEAPLALEQMIHNHVEHVLALNHGNKQQAARQLGISRSTLYRILRQDQVESH